MLAIHVNWTAPFRFRQQRSDYLMDPLEALTSITTAMFWKRSGGQIHLYTDAAGLRFYEQAGLAGAYDHIDTRALEQPGHDATLLPQAPCLGRMQVLGSLHTPFVAMDLDLAFFGAGNFPYATSDLCCLHWELPMPPSYPAQDAECLPNGFRLPDGLDFLTLVPNIAFLYVGQPDFFRPYSELAADYVKRSVAQQLGPSTFSGEAKPSPGQDEGLPTNLPAIFADQRLLGMLANKRGLRVETLWNEIFTCGPFGDRWEVLSREGTEAKAGSRGLVAPYWVLDPARYDSRKETVDCAYLWFEKALYYRESRHRRRRQRVVGGIAERLASQFGGNPITTCVLELLSGWGREASTAD